MLKNIIFFSIFISIISSCTYKNKVDVLQQNLCDTTETKYASTIAPILSANCNSCHGGSSPSANINLETYDEVKKYVNNGTLIGSIKHKSGYSNMPQGASKLDDCKILKIETWIGRGAQNN